MSFVSGSTLCRIAFAVAVLVVGQDPAGAAQPHAADIPDPIALYGDKIAFEVFRKGERIGDHTVWFARDGRDVVATTDSSLRLNVLFIDVYRFAYRSEERWRDGRLAALDVKVDDDGDPFAMRARTVREGVLEVQSGRDPFLLEKPVFPTSHWNAAVLSRTQVLNTLTGRLNTVHIVPHGREMVQTERGAVEAIRYAYTGELQTEVWYDGAGRWVKMRFQGEDGSAVEYACRRCQGGMAAVGPAGP